MARAVSAFATLPPFAVRTPAVPAARCGWTPPARLVGGVTPNRVCPASAAGFAAGAAAGHRSSGGGGPRMDAGNEGAVILCPGQGAQAVGMASAWADASPDAAAVLARADAALGTSLPGGVPLSTLMREGPKATLDRTDVAQPAIFVASMAALAGARETGVLPPTGGVAAAAGLSLGEYTALTVAGALTFDDALGLVALRGRAMQEAAEASDGGMLALVGASEEVATAIVDAVVAEMGAETVLVAANFNAPGQVVLSGSTAAIARAEAVAKAPPFKLRRAIVLDVAGAFHSPLMAPAAARLAAALADVPIAAPAVPVMANVAAAAHGESPDGIRDALVAQLTSPVRWAACCEALAADEALGGGGRLWLELAPGKTLGGMMRKINPGISVVGCAEPAAPATA